MRNARMTCLLLLLAVVAGVVAVKALAQPRVVLLKVVQRRAVLPRVAQLKVVQRIMAPKVIFPGIA